ncbi:MAG: hypothetical protein ACLPIX_03140 [Rhodomicrobium sp.]
MLTRSIPEALNEMDKQPSASHNAKGGKSQTAAAQDKKKRLAEALRQNLAKRKDKKEPNHRSKPDAG